MPQPHAIFMRSQGKNKVVQGAKDDKERVASSDDRRRDAFFKALDKYSAREIEVWIIYFEKLRNHLKKKQNDAALDKTEDLKLEVKVVRLVKKILQDSHFRSELTALMGRDAKTVIRADLPTPAAGANLMLVIALLGVLEVLLRLRKSK